MFTWICPQCGREVPPSYDECPDCAERQKAAATGTVTSPAPQAPAAVPPMSGHPPPTRPSNYGSQSNYAPPQNYPPQQNYTSTQNVPPAASYAPATPQGYAAPPPQQQTYLVPPPGGRGLPTWLLTILFALGFMVLGLGVYWALQHFQSGGRVTASQPPPVENASAKGGAQAHPLQKYIEVTGVRLLQDSKKKTEARFLVVNHSGAEIADLAGNVSIWGRTAKSEEEAVGKFSFKMPSLGAYESKEMTAPVDTKLKVYELPDWQNVTSEVQLTSP